MYVSVLNLQVHTSMLSVSIKQLIVRFRISRQTIISIIAGVSSTYDYKHVHNLIINKYNYIQRHVYSRNKYSTLP